MKKMDIIRKGELVGVLLSFLLISCENSTTSSEDSSDKLFLSFDMRLPVDGNNYYHLDINRNTWQTLHRVSAHIETSEGEPVEFFWMEWESDLYWYFGDTLGYIIHRGLTDDMVYVSYDTTYITGFNGMEVPTINPACYSNSKGEFNQMGGFVRNMIGDTARIEISYGIKEVIQFYVVLD